MADADHVKGTGEMQKQAVAGLALFKEDVVIEGDADAAKKYKDEVDEQFKALEAEAAALTGKDNKKARSEKSKQASDLKKAEKYIDAEKICKGNPPKFGNFVKAGSAPAAAKEETPAPASEAPAEEEKDKKDDKKDDKKKPKKTESAGISPAERKELESLKTDIISKKAALKETGMSGGQINKNEEIVAMVARMQELKEKESPGSSSKKDEKKDGGKKKVLSAEASQQKESLEREIEEYREKCAKEFGMTKKEIASDPDMQELQEKLKKLK